MNNAKYKEYAGFWVRTVAALIDSVLISVINVPLLMLIYGQEYWLKESWLLGFWHLILGYIFPVTAIMLFWLYKSATPGKIIMKLKIIDAETGGKPSVKQFIGRYLGYFISYIFLFLGVIWVGIDKRKQGWHDKLAKTVVVRKTAEIR